MSAITALTAQNTTGVTGIMEVSPEFLEQQLDAVITDIRPDAVKIGMVSSEELIKMISKKLKEYHLENIVVDPVMVATSGSRLISETAIDTLKTQLLPMATVITPNIPEAEVLAEMEIRSEDDMVEAAKKIHEMYHCAVLCKGGHSLNDANDLLYQDGEATWFHGKESTTRTLTEPAVPYPAQSHPIWQKDILWKNLFTARKSISAGRWKPC